jgi:hypothetical protein
MMVVVFVAMMVVFVAGVLVLVAQMVVLVTAVAVMSRVVVIERAIRGAGVGQRLVHDLLDGARAAAALPAAAEAAIDFAGGERVLGRRHRVADVVVSQDVA